MHDFQIDIDAVSQIAAVPKILDVICRTTGMGFAAVARVTEDRWITCAVKDEIAFGLVPGSELEVKTTICDEIRASGTGVVIDHVSENPNFCRHHTPLQYGFQSYISMPIVLPDGEFFGTLCAIDPRPARLDTPEIIGMFQLFADLIANHLSTHRRLAVSEASLLSERTTSILREQFIAVLGHDLRNPLASIEAGHRILSRNNHDEKSLQILSLMQSSLQRMDGLITNVLDFARGRLGEGILLEWDRHADVLPMLEQVVAELRSTHPDREIVADFAQVGPIDCDPARIGQVLSNLLGNALTHGAPDRPVEVKAFRHDGQFELSVTNSGDPISDDMLPNLFKPFFRASVRPSQQGLGLGLFIASEIAHSHGGSLEAVSTQAQTRFTFSMPAVTK